MQLLLSPILLALALVGQSAAAPTERGNNHQINYVDEPDYFTSAFHTRAVNTTIIDNAGNPVAGQSGAFGQYAFRVNTDKKIICWDITTVGVDGKYQSPAITATHLHQARAGAAGPPRIAFPNPSYQSTNAMGQEVRRSKGCQKGPFRTGVRANNGTGADTGTASGFRLRQIEADPAGFFGDVHTQQFSAGAIRGQLYRSELEVGTPRSFSSTIVTTADANQVISTMTNSSVPGAQGAKGHYRLRINTDADVLCYDIVLTGRNLSTDYSSPAKTATHTHQAGRGLNGPPRLAYKNPQKVSERQWNKQNSFIKSKGNSQSRISSACIKGPFTTGLLNAATGLDTGSASGFTLRQLQDNPTGFFSDVHTAQFTQGAVRGQMSRA